MRTNIVLNTVHCTPNADGHLFLLGVTANGDARALQRALLHLPPLAQLCLANTAHPHGTAEQEGTGRSQTFCTRELQCRPHTEARGASGGFGCRLPCASEGPLGRTPTAPEESHGKAERGLWVNTYIRVISPAHRAAVLHRVAQRRGLPPHPAADPRRRGSERQAQPPDRATPAGSEPAAVSAAPPPPSHPAEGALRPAPPAPPLAGRKGDVIPPARPLRRSPGPAAAPGPSGGCTRPSPPARTAPSAGRGAAFPGPPPPPRPCPAPTTSSPRPPVLAGARPRGGARRPGSRVAAASSSARRRRRGSAPAR